MAVAVTNTAIGVYGTSVDVTSNAATSAVVDATEVFTITTKKPGSKLLIQLTNANTHGTYTYSIAGGDLWAKKLITGSIVQNKRKALMIETGNVGTKTGTIVVTLTPASGKRLLTDHVATMEVIELI